MAITRRHMSGLSTTDVFRVLSNGFSYADWVVGTRAVRAVDDGWPNVDSRLHYTVGHWPLRKDDVTIARRRETDQLLELEARAWPAGAARIVLAVEAVSSGTLVSIDETPKAGVALRLHNPLFNLMIKLRNVETLRRLEGLARRE